MSFTCPKCGTHSAHPVDLQEGWCGRCKEFTACPVRGAGVNACVQALIDAANRHGKKIHIDDKPPDDPFALDPSPVTFICEHGNWYWIYPVED